MAFTIYEGTGSANDMYAKLVEMWTFDSTDTENHEAVYGNVKIKTYGDYIRLYNTADESSYINNQNTGSNATFSVVKIDNAIMLTWVYNGAPYCYVIGDLANVDGGTGKGAACAGDGRFISSVLGTITQPIIGQDLIITDVVNQVVQLSGSVGGYYFPNIFRLIATSFVDYTTIRGVYTLGDTRYYICGVLAIEEV